MDSNTEDSFNFNTSLPLLAQQVNGNDSLYNITTISMLPTPAVPTGSVRDENLARIEIATLSLILLLAIIGNGLMLVALRKILQYRPMSRMYFFMLNLSMADLFVAFGNILPQLAWDITFRFQGPDLLCRIVKFLQVFVLYLSTYVLTSMAIDRYLVVCHHNFSRNYYGSLRGPKVLVICSYVLSFILATPQAFIFSLKDVEETPGKIIQDCWVTFIEPWGAKAYVTYFVVAAFIIPLLIIGLSYGAICYKVVGYRLPQDGKVKKKIKRTNKDKFSMSSTSELRSRNDAESSVSIEDVSISNNKGSTQRTALQRQISRAKIKTLKLTLVVVLAFFICWAPFCFTHLFVVYSSHNVGPMQVILLLLASLNSCTNPWIYLAFSESLCNQLRLFLGLGLKRGSDEESIGDEVNNKAEGYGNHNRNKDNVDLPKINNLHQHAPIRNSIGSSPSEQCGQKPETKSEVL